MLCRTPLSEANVAYKQWYLSTYLLLKCFETLIANMDMRLLALYTQRFPWKYNIRRPFEKPAQTIDKYDNHAVMIDLVTRCSVRKILCIHSDDAHWSILENHTCTWNHF